MAVEVRRTQQRQQQGRAATADHQEAQEAEDHGAHRYAAFRSTGIRSVTFTPKNFATFNALAGWIDLPSSRRVNVRQSIPSSAARERMV